MKKRHHHYVWRNYLRAWAEDDFIWCRREGTVFRPNIMGIGQQRDFYKLKLLSEMEISFIRALAERQHGGVLQELNDNWIDILQEIARLHAKHQNEEIGNEELNALLDELVHNTEENYHEAIESMSIKYMESIRRNDITFFDVDQSRAEFSYYLCQQYARTRRIKENVTTSYKEIEDKLGINIENVWSVMCEKTDLS